jgi:hypothetical protein
MWRTIDKAVDYTAQFFGLDLRTVVTTVGLIAFGFFLHWKIRGLVETKEEVSKYVILIAAPFVLFLAALLLYNLLRAPYFVYSEEFGNVATKLSASEGARGSLEQRAQSAESRLRELEAIKPPLIVPGSDPNTIAQHEKQKRKAIRDQIAVLINEGNGIKQACSAPATKEAEAENTANLWAKKTFSYLASIEPSYSARFDASEGPSYGGVGSGTKGNVWNYVNKRIQTLAQLLQELKD